MKLSAPSTAVPRVLLPNESVKTSTALLIAAAWVAGVIAFWVFVDLGVLPSAAETAVGFGSVVGTASVQMFTSLMLSLEAIAWATGIGLVLCYLSTIPIFKAPVVLIGKLRFLSLTGLIVIFYKFTDGGHDLKLAVLTFSIVTFLINDMLQEIENIPSGRYDHARTIGLSRFGVLREVVIRGTLASAFDSVRANAAMAWMMLTAVESLSRSDGGIGVLLYNLSRMQDYGPIFGIQLMILVVGVGQDYLIKYIKAVACPYAKG